MFRFAKTLQNFENMSGFPKRVQSWKNINVCKTCSLIWKTVSVPRKCSQIRKNIHDLMAFKFWKSLTFSNNIHKFEKLFTFSKYVENVKIKSRSSKFWQILKKNRVYKKSVYLKKYSCFQKILSKFEKMFVFKNYSLL